MKAIFDTRVNIEVILKGLAIILIVFNHAFDSFYEAGASLEGGMTVLLMLSGYLFARFILSNKDPQHLHTSLVRLGVNIFWPSFIVLILSFIIKQRFSWAELFYVYSWIDDHQIAYYMSWYVETILQIFLIIALLFAVPAFRNAFFARPFMASVVLYLAAIGIYLAVITFVSPGGLRPFPFVFLWNFILGWVIYFGTQRNDKTGLGRLALVAAIAAIPMLCLTNVYFMNSIPPTAKVALLCAIGLMIWQPIIYLPKPAAVFLSLAGQASYTIFLLHLPMFGLYRALFDIPSASLCAAFAVLSCIGLWVAFTSAKRAYNRLKPAS